MMTVVVWEILVLERMKRQTTLPVTTPFAGSLPTALNPQPGRSY